MMRDTVFVHQAIQGLLEVVFAAGCPLCGRGGMGGRLCEPCFAGLPGPAPVRCRTCDGELPEGGAGIGGRASRCASCLDGRPFELARALGRHEGDLRTLIHALKFGGRKALGHDLGRRAAGRLAGELGEVDVVVPVPLGRRRRRRRGFDQAEVVAGGVALALGLSWRRALRRVRETAPQTSLTRAGRRRNVAGAFAAAGVDGRRVLLVDDVMTTGSTVDAAAGAIRRGGAAACRVLVLARA